MSYSVHVHQADRWDDVYIDFATFTDENSVNLFTTNLGQGNYEVAIGSDKYFIVHARGYQDVTFYTGSAAPGQLLDVKMPLAPAPTLEWQSPDPDAVLRGTVRLIARATSVSNVWIMGYYALQPNDLQSPQVEWRKIGDARQTSNDTWECDWNTTTVPDQVKNEGWGTIKLVWKADDLLGQQIADTLQAYRVFYRILNHPTPPAKEHHRTEHAKAQLTSEQ